MTRKRLKLLPEILPAPPPQSPNGDPRERTLKRLGRLVAAATTAAAVSNCDAVGSGYAVVDPMPPPPQCDGLSQSIHAEAKFLSPTLLLVTLGASSMTGAAYLPDRFHLDDGAFVVRSKAIASDRVEVEIELSGAPKYVSFQVGVSCPNGVQAVGVAVLAAKEGDPVSASAPIQVKLGDTYPIEPEPEPEPDASSESTDAGVSEGEGGFATPPPGSE
jgi:hypothetical protein